jgi:endonuclease YncB( thermonuclease family)
MRFFLLLMLFCLPLSADWLDSCNDGDTCRIKANEKTVKARKVRLAGIDAPEKKQTHWQESRDYLVSILKDKELELKCSGRSYDRATCVIYYKGVSGKVSANEEMVKAGMAWNYPQYSERHFAVLEKEARDKKLGLWKLGKPASPFCFRHVRNGNCRSNGQFQP